jgi:ribonuclease HIII
LGKDYDLELPKGAGVSVDAVAKSLVSEKGAEVLAKIAKMHFRTAFRAQNLPEPPKIEWRTRETSKKTKNSIDTHS